MHIIVFAHRLATPRSVTLTARHVIFASIFATLAIIAGAALLYYVSFKYAAAIRLPILETLVKNLQASEARRNEEFLRQNLNAMAVKLGEMQAQLMRLDALGERVSGLAGVKPQEFRTSDPPGRGGAIVINGSMAGIQGVGNMAPYAASKHAVAGLAKSIAVAYGQFGIRCNFQGPGATETPMYEQAVHDVMAYRAANPTTKVPGKIQGPLGRNQTAEEQAEVACFLLSDAASAMTGALVIADCGATAY